MARVTTRITRKPRHRDVLGDYAARITMLVGRAGNLVRNTAVSSIQQGAKSGVIYEKYNPRRTHTASASGEAPASDTGFLANNITTRTAPNGLSGEVVSQAQYSEYLEFGTLQMGARPFMHPALEENRPKILARLRKLMG